MAILTQSTCGLVATTSAPHAGGRQLDPGQGCVIKQNVIPSSADARNKKQKQTHLLAHSLTMDMQGLPSASRVLGGCDTTTPRALRVQRRPCSAMPGLLTPVDVLTAGPCRRRVQRRVRANAGAVLIPRQC